MHRPGHIQGGQEAKRGYLLLGVYHRRIPGVTQTLPLVLQYCVYIEEKSFRSTRQKFRNVFNRRNISATTT
jgi:hypothetical protein